MKDFELGRIGFTKAGFCELIATGIHLIGNFKNRYGILFLFGSVFPFVFNSFNLFHNGLRPFENPFCIKITDFRRKIGCIKLSWIIYLVIRYSVIHISEPTRLGMISYAVLCLKKKK